jgi:hypothetical protein
MTGPTEPTAAESASIECRLADIKWVVGLMSITFLLDGQPLKSIPLGGSAVFGVSPHQHTIQTILKASSIVTLFIPITRRSKILTFSVAPNSQTVISASYNRTWGNIELQAS